MLFRNLIGVRWLSMSARTAFFVWIALQLFGAWAQASGSGSVSAPAHLGGASAGFACWMLFRDDETTSDFRGSACAGRRDWV